MKNTKTKKRRQFSISDYADGVLNADRTMLGRTLTLIESNLPEHQETAQNVLEKLLPFTGNSIRIGITGVPGVGKSTFIESFGNALIEQNHRIAVLAIDPSSSITHGSILGDKTRMETLSRNENAFIRPSPSGGTLGGVARKTRETILVCEAAGFDTIVIETIGVGQSEILVRSMVDFFLLLQITGGGDDLQSIKKGVMELADAIFINKADGENLKQAERVKKELELALHYRMPATENWESPVLCGSALQNVGIIEMIDIIQKFCKNTAKSGLFQKRRQVQLKQWLKELISEEIMTAFYKNPSIISELPNIENSVISGNLPVVKAAEKLLKSVFDNKSK